MLKVQVVNNNNNIYTSNVNINTNTTTKNLYHCLPRPKPLLIPLGPHLRRSSHELDAYTNTHVNSDTYFVAQPVTCAQVSQAAAKTQPARLCSRVRFVGVHHFLSNNKIPAVIIHHRRRVALATRPGSL